MSDNVKVDEGKGPLIATDDVGGVQYQKVKLYIGSNGEAEGLSIFSPLPINDAGGSLTVDSAALGATSDAEATGNGSSIGLLKRLRTLLAGGLPAALTGSGNLKVAVQETSLSAPLPVRLSDGSEGLGTTSKRLHVDDGGSSLSVDDNGSTLSVDDGGGSLTVDGSVSVGAALPAGNNNIGDVDVASIATGTNTIGNVGLAPRTSGGLSIFRSLDLDETEEEVKGSAGQVYWYHFANRAASERFLKFYNGTAASVTVGTTTPVLTLPLPKESAGHVPIPIGLAFSTAITVAVTTGIADNNAGAPAENDVVLNLGYA